MLNRILGVALAAALSIFAYAGAVLIRENLPTPHILPARSTVFIRAATSLGSGVHIGNGIIVTAAHVVGDAKTVQVETEDGKTFTGTVTKTDAKHDLALVSVVAFDPAFPASPFACRSPELREPVEIIGNPMGVKFVHTWGRVAKAHEYLKQLDRDTFVIDAPIAPGNSGGPVFDRHGYIIGIVDAVMIAPLDMTDRSLVGIGFAIPVTDLCTII